jgi:ABC-type nitrate/sulfonate/bicarbonate transport system permease component
MPARNSAWSRTATYAIALAAGAVIWEIGARQVNPAFISPFSTTVAELYGMTISGVLPKALGISAVIYITGLVAAIIVGAAIGLLLARVRLLRVAFESYIMLLYATPMVALIPFIMSMMGFGFLPKAVIVFLFALFPVLYNTVEGARSVKPELIEVARSFRSREWAIWRDILIPYTLPFTMTGIRQSIGRGLVGLVAAEFFLSGTGIGLLIMQSERDFDVPALYGTIILVAILGALLMGVGRTLENRFAAWRGLSR